MRTILILLAAVTLMMIGCNRPAPGGKAEKSGISISDSMMHLIEFDTVSMRPVSNEITLSGQVSFDENKMVKVYPNASGQVDEVKVSLGDFVNKGQTLAVIRSADVAGNYADLSSASADVAIAKRELDNAESLYNNGISSEREYTIAKQNYEKALTAYEKVKQAIAINGGGNTSANGSFLIKAPQSGYIVEKNVNAGSFIRNDMSNNLFTISDLKDVWVWANVFEADIPKVKPGYDAQITTLAYPDKVYNGKVDQVSEVLDPNNKALRAKIVLPNNDLTLKPDMFANVSISNISDKKELAIPSNAVIFDSGRNYVVVYKSRTQIEAKEITISKTTSHYTYINGGLEPGEVVVSKNAILLYNALSE